MQNLFKKSRPIERKEANDIVEKRKKYFRQPAKLLARLARLMGNQEDFYNYFEHEGEAFLFDKDSVLRHFFENGVETGATHLLVIPGAHLKTDEEFNTGDPTICITGVKQNENKTSNGKIEVSFTRTTIGNKPYDEHPPVVPDSGTRNKLLENDEIELSFYI